MLRRPIPQRWDAQVKAFNEVNPIIAQDAVDVDFHSISTAFTFVAAPVQKLLPLAPFFVGMVPFKS